MENKQDLRSFHLFAGAGGGILADQILEHRVIGACEVEQYPRDVLLQRQKDGCLPEFPIWDDIRTLDGKPWRGAVDILAGGFPCQDISAAGKGKGLAGERSGLWFEFERIIEEMRPKFVFIENSPMLRTRGLVVVLQGLARLGYDAKWCKLGAWHVGAPHKRDRMWILAYPMRERGCSGHPSWEDAENAGKLRGSQGRKPRGLEAWDTEPDVGRVAHGVANRVDRSKAIGNGQVPQCAAMAWRLLTS